MTDRKPAVAGSFYPGTKAELQEELGRYFRLCEPQKNTRNIRALISPHAGYVFSGEVAASSFNQLDDSCIYKRVFVIASSHRARYRGASIYKQGNYITPLGSVKVDLQLAEQLIQKNDVFTFHPEAHYDEHSLEVQLPFLQYKLKKEFLLVPIVIGTNNTDEIKAIADGLKTYFTDENLFVISTDFSHYPSYEDAQEIDAITAESILKNDPGLFYQTIQKNKEKGIINLSTSICGWTSVLTLLYLTAENEALEYQHIQYKNSGDSKLYSDKNRVVGYHSIVVAGEDSSDFTLTDSNKKQLLKIARNRFEKYLKRELYIPEEGLPSILKADAGAFVSIYLDDQLRGCIGSFSSGRELYKLVEELTVSSLNDHRFDPVSKEGLDDINIEISVLTPLKRIKSLDEFVLGKHGIYIKQGHRSGTFLPQVAEKTNWTKEGFVSRCSENKARIGSDGWKTAELFTYEAIVFSEKDFKQL